MQLRIVVSTPPGKAKSTEAQLRLILLKLKKPLSTGVNQENSQFYWELDCNITQYSKLTKNVINFQKLAGLVIDAKVFQKAVKQFGGATPEDIKIVREMIMQGTTIDIIKNATAQELVEANKTFWQKLKERFTHHGDYEATKKTE